MRSAYSGVRSPAEVFRQVRSAYSGARCPGGEPRQVRLIPQVYNVLTECYQLHDMSRLSAPPGKTCPAGAPS